MPGSAATRGMESKNKFFLCTPEKKKRKKTTSPGKTTSDYSELLRPGARVWRRKQESFLFPSSRNRRARCRWTAGWRLVPWPRIGVSSLLRQVYADSKSVPLPGGRRRTGDYDSGVFRVVQPLGMLPQAGEPVPCALALRSRSAPSPHRGNWFSSMPCTVYWLQAFASPPGVRQ